MTDAMREVVASVDNIDDGGWIGDINARAILSAIAALPLADRLAYARGLVEAEGWSVVKVPDKQELGENIPARSYTIVWRQGHNACRAATLATEDRDE